MPHDHTANSSRREPLEKRAERFELLVESVEDYAIFMLSEDGIVATWNRGAERIKGYRADEIIGRHFSTFYCPEDTAKCDVELSIAREVGKVEDEGYRVRKDGSVFWASIVITALRDDRGKLMGFAKVTRDLTERKRAEEERLLLAQQTTARQVAERALHRLARLQSVLAAIVLARTPEELATVIVRKSIEALDARSGALLRENDERSIRLVASYRLTGAIADVYRVCSVDAHLPAAAAFRSRAAEWIEDPETL